MIVFAREHVPRNLFHLAIASLSECIRLKILNPNEWEFVGVGGSVSSSKTICNLGMRKESDACIRIIQNVPENEYKRILSGGDIGLSLTMSPNPSFSLFDFAAAGMIVVTNGYETRTQETLDEISENFIVVKPSIYGIVSGISKALLKIDNVAQRHRGSKLNLPQRWDDNRCYGEELFNKVKFWLHPS